MRIYFDEAGNTGCVVNKSNNMNFGIQRHFALCGVIVYDEDDEKSLRKKYKEFLDMFQIKGEQKGSDLLTRESNDKLEYFIDNILDNKHFSICYYDKKFYLSSLIYLTFLGEEFRKQFPVEFYNFVSCLSFENESLFVEYSKLVMSPSIESLRHFLEIVIYFDYRLTSKSNNPLIMIAEKILTDNNEGFYINDLLTTGCYDNPNFTNVINLNTLSELIFTIKKEHNLSNNTLDIIHDSINGFSTTMSSELSALQIAITYSDSKDDQLIQMADNVVSVFYKVMNEMIHIFDNKKEWQIESEWILKLAAKLYKKITLKNIKFTVPVQNWAVAICICQMFDDNYPRERRKNLYFNQYYQEALSSILETVAVADYDYENINETLKK